MHFFPSFVSSLKARREKMSEFPSGARENQAFLRGWQVVALFFTQHLVGNDPDGRPPHADAHDIVLLVGYEFDPEAFFFETGGHFKRHPVLAGVADNPPEATFEVEVNDFTGDMMFHVQYFEGKLWLYSLSFHNFSMVWRISWMSWLCSRSRRRRSCNSSPLRE